MSILRDHAIPSARRLIGQNFLFTHDNDPEHAARVCKDCLQHLEQSNESKIMHWPPQSPDLNPLERKIRKVCQQEAWNQIVPETIEKLIKRN